MRNILKRAAALLLAAALCLSFAGCYDENNTWAAKKGEETLPIGSYVYYLYNSYIEAASLVASDQEILKAEIKDEDSGETVKAEEWIRAKALNHVKSYYFIADKFDQLGLELTEEDQTSITGATDSMWTYYKTTLEEMGIAKESYNKAYSLYSTRYQKVMKAMYGEGGEKEVSEDELKSHFTENYYNYEYFYASLTKTDDEGNSVDMTDEEKETAKAKLDEYVSSINTGATTMEAAATAYATDILGNAEGSTYAAPSPTKKTNISTIIKTALDGADEDKAVLAESDAGYYVVRRLSIDDAFQDLLEDETQKFSLISDLKGEEFSDYVEEQGKNGVEGLEINERALKSYSVSKLVTDNNKNGTSSASSQAESSEASSEAGETSSQAESETSSEASSEE